MSDTTSRPVGGPPKRAAKAPASSLIKRNRSQPSFPSAAEAEVSAVETDRPETAQLDQADETITPAAFLDRPDAPVSPPSTVAPVGEEPTTEPAVTESAATAQPTAVAPVQPAAPAVSNAEQDALVNTTFRVRRSSKKAFDAAFLAAKLHEGWPSAEAYFQDLLERETKRIQDDYNNGQPFPIREKALPRGRPIGS
ncbi:hypothetical protein LLS1_37580 [Leifsonia sp. LS1]|uniref:hypothetical protein n=1 Tax=Leifsonia sp. LS1 TaxID=2828483 RepID=UPI001CFD5E3E|nr:hypothetical protein [Leifsonia sp. LS1]GIT82089.1 hypothetical protein LLS1_37580 [Leifsonia sp. LS1]